MCVLCHLGANFALFLSYHVHYQKVVLARKCLNAEVSCLTESSVILFTLKYFSVSLQIVTIYCLFSC